MPVVIKTEETEPVVLREGTVGTKKEKTEKVDVINSKLKTMLKSKSKSKQRKNPMPIVSQNIKRKVVEEPEVEISIKRTASTYQKGGITCNCNCKYNDNCTY